MKNNTWEIFQGNLIHKFNNGDNSGEQSSVMRRTIACERGGWAGLVRSENFQSILSRGLFLRGGATSYRPHPNAILLAQSSRARTPRAR